MRVQYCIYHSGYTTWLPCPVHTRVHHPGYPALYTTLGTPPLATLPCTTMPCTTRASWASLGFFGLPGLPRGGSQEDGGWTTTHLDTASGYHACHMLLPCTTLYYPAHSTPPAPRRWFPGSRETHLAITPDARHRPLGYPACQPGLLLGSWPLTGEESGIK